jgi:hypothetical protein
VDPLAPTPPQPNLQVPEMATQQELDLRAAVRPPVLLRLPDPFIRRRWMIVIVTAILAVPAGFLVWNLRHSSSTARIRPSWQRDSEPDFDSDEPGPAIGFGANGEASAIAAAWDSLTLRYENFRHLHGCTQPAPAALCHRYQALEQPVQAKMAAHEEDSDLLIRIRELTHEISEATASGG